MQASYLKTGAAIVQTCSYTFFISA